MDVLKFEIKLKEKPVIFVTKDGIEKTYFLKELTGEQRQKYNQNFDIKFDIDDTGKAKVTPGNNFKMVPANEFLAMCLYDDSGKLVDADFINNLGTTTTEALHKVALKLSGLDEKSRDEAKNELEASDTTGIA